MIPRLTSGIFKTNGQSPNIHSSSIICSAFCSTMADCSLRTAFAATSLSASSSLSSAFLVVNNLNAKYASSSILEDAFIAGFVENLSSSSVECCGSTPILTFRSSNPSGNVCFFATLHIRLLSPVKGTTSAIVAAAANGYRKLAFPFPNNSSASISAIPAPQKSTYLPPV